MKKIYGLDTLRFLAFLSIFSYHAIGAFPYGYLGVDFFFVLSSFLLTLLALNELEIEGSFSRKNFFFRRSLRIFPLYFLVVFLVLVVLKIIVNYYNISVGFPDQEWKYWLFLCNISQDDHIYPLRFLWSIAVEEQFYLLFMLLGVFFKRHLIKVIAGLCIVYFAFMFLASRFNWETYTNTLAYFINFASGMFAAYLYKNNKQEYIRRYGILLLVVLSTIIVFTVPDFLFKSMTSMSFGLFILVFIPLTDKLKSTNVLFVSEYLGRYSYGLYVYSGFVFLFSHYYLEPYIASSFLNTIIQFTLLVIIAISSFELYEKHFLRLKKHFRVNNST